MTPTELRAARERLGETQAGLARRLRLGKQGGRTVRSWELAEVAVPGPASVAIELMVEKATAEKTSP